MEMHRESDTSFGVWGSERAETAEQSIDLVRNLVRCWFVRSTMYSGIDEVPNTNGGLFAGCNLQKRI